MALKIGKKVNNYRTKSGAFQFVYEIKGSVEEVKEYNEFRESNGWQPDLFHSLQPLESGTPVEMNFAGDRYIAKQDLEEMYEKEQVRTAIANAYVNVFGKRRERTTEDVPTEVTN